MVRFDPDTTNDGIDAYKDCGGSTSEKEEIYSPPFDEKSRSVHLINYYEYPGNYEESETEQVNNISQPKAPEIDIRKEFLEINTNTNKKPNLVKSAAPFEVIRPPQTKNALSGPGMFEKMEKKDSQITEQNALALFDYKIDISNDDLPTLLKYTLVNDVVTIPALGTFKRKKNFDGMATIQLIQKMLSQSTPIL